MKSPNPWKNKFKNFIENIVLNQNFTPHKAIHTHLHLPKAGTIRVGIEFERSPTHFLKMRLAYALEAETVTVMPTVVNTENTSFPIALRVFSNQIQDHIQDKSAQPNIIKNIIINQIFSKKNAESMLNNLQKIHGIKTNIINKYIEITQPIFAKNINGVIDIIADKIPDPNQSMTLAHLPDVLKNIAQTPPTWVWEDPNTHSHFQYWQGTVPNQPHAQAQLSLMRLLWDFPETETPRVSVQISHAALHSRAPFGAVKS